MTVFVYLKLAFSDRYVKSVIMDQSNARKKDGFRMGPQRRRENDTSKTKALILASASKALVEKGMDGLTISGLARDLDMSHANVYRHFRSREDLVLAIADHWMREMRIACEASIQASGTPAHRLTQLILTIRNQITLRAENPNAAEIYSFVREKCPDRAIAHHAHRKKLIVEILKHGVSADSASAQKGADIVIAAIEGFVNPFLIAAMADKDLKLTIKQLCRVLVKGLS